MAGGAETPNIAALPAIAWLGTCESARGPDADRHVKLLSQFAVEGSLSGAYSHLITINGILDHHRLEHHITISGMRTHKTDRANACTIYGDGPGIREIPKVAPARK